MKIVSIKELHDETGRIVSQTEQDTIVITNRGKKVAIIIKYSDDALPTAPFPRRDPHLLPKIDIDSTALISADRDE